MNVSLSCDHAEGRLQLLDGLHTGGLSSDAQQRLSRLLEGSVSVPSYFRSTRIEDYEIESTGDGNYVETWTCPVCGQYHRDERDQVDDE